MLIMFESWIQAYVLKINMSLAKSNKAEMEETELKVLKNVRTCELRIRKAYWAKFNNRNKYPMPMSKNGRNQGKRS